MYILVPVGSAVHVSGSVLPLLQGGRYSTVHFGVYLLWNIASAAPPIAHFLPGSEISSQHYCASD